MYHKQLVRKTVYLRSLQIYVLSALFMISPPTVEEISSLEATICVHTRLVRSSVHTKQCCSNLPATKC